MTTECPNCGNENCTNIPQIFVIQTLIDTGASVCMIDSTYAVDSCNIILPESNATIGNTFGKRIKAVDLNLDSISLGGPLVI